MKHDVVLQKDFLKRNICRTAMQSWSPDRKTIDAQLNEIKKRVSMDVSALD